MVTEKGYIGQFTFQNDETGFYVFDLVMESGKITCVGNARGFSIGETVEIDGDYVNHNIYGKQLKVIAIRAIEPDTPVAIERYLGSGAIKGIGEAMAKKIVKEFGKDTFRIAQDNPIMLSKIKGISEKKAYDIGAQIAEKRDARDAMIFLGNYGISQTLANKIYNKYGIGIYEIMRENPYKLAEDIRGIGFKIADDIASKSGIRMDSDYRIKCGILHCLNELSYDGNTYYPMDKLIDKAYELLSVEKDIIEIQIMNLSMERKLVVKNSETENGPVKKVYLSVFYYEELKCARKLIELRDGFDQEKYSDKDEIVKRIEAIGKEMDITLDDLQIEAVCKCVTSGVFVLSGGPGTGKTTTINTIIRYLSEEGMDFYLAAPTGRAAKRISETTGYEARTIHRLLENSGNPSEYEDDRIVYFNKNEDDPLEADVVIIDEMSMVDIHLMKALLDAMVAGMKLILVGDVDQLASVGPGEVLKDILECGKFTTVRLEKIFRQDAESHIISNAYKINNGENIDFSQKYEDFFLLEKDDPKVIYEYIEKLMKENVPRRFGIDPLDIQVLTPMRNGRLGITVLNQVMQDKFNPHKEGKAECVRGDSIFRLGDKVMQIKNNYNIEWEVYGDYNVVIESGTGIFNGDVGKIAKIDNYLKEVTVLFDDGRQAVYGFEDLDELELAYSITIHKSQGSEYPVIIIPLLTGPKMLLTRNLLYTAVTRAQQCVILIGSGNTFLDMIHTDTIFTRYTSLKERILEID